MSTPHPGNDSHSRSLLTLECLEDAEKALKNAMRHLPMDDDSHFADQTACQNSLSAALREIRWTRGQARC